MKKSGIKKFYKKKAETTSPKSKKTKIVPKSSQGLFPKIPRVIPEHRSPQAQTVLLVSVCFLCGVLLWAIFLGEQLLTQSYVALQLAAQQRNQTERDIQKWQKIIAAYPNYRDGYFQLALREYEVGDMALAQKYNQQALVIDPNFMQARELEKKVQINK